MNNLIKSIQESIKIFFDEDICLKQKNYSSFILEGRNSSPANNYVRDFPEKITTVNWFDDIWIYLKVDFFKIQIEQNLYSENGKKGFLKKDYLKNLEVNHLKFGPDFFSTFITISIFQGDYSLESKSQLFRAEWDNFENYEDKHPQPHWHFYVQKKYFDTVEEFEKDDDIKEGFLSTLSQKNIDIQKIHFAMNGNWAIGDSHFHEINNQNTLINWFVGLLSHIKSQLEFANDK